MRTRKRFLGCLVVLTCVGSSGPAAGAGSYVPIGLDPVAESWRWRSFHELEGRGLSCLTEGPNGHVYFGKDEGVRVYDGLRWGVYRSEEGILGAPVNAMMTATDGAIYAGTETSLLRFDGTGWNVVFPPEGDLHWRFTDLEEGPDGSIWAATNWGALRVAPDGHYLYTTDTIGQSIRRFAGYIRHSIVPDQFIPERTILSRIGLLSAPVGANGQVERLLVYGVIDAGPADQVGVKAGDRILAVNGRPPQDPNTALIGPPGTVVTLTIDREGYADPIDFEIVREAEEETFKPFVVYDVLAAKDGSLWFGLETGEVLQFRFLLEEKGATGLWQLHQADGGLIVGEQPRIGQSPDGQIWTVSSTQQGGLNRFDGIAWHHTRLSGLGGSDLNTSFATTPDGSFWVGGNVLSVLRSGSWFTYPDVASIPSHRSRLMVASDGALWVAGLGQFAARFTLSKLRWQGYKGLVFQADAEDGTTWFLSDDNSVVARRGESWTRYDRDDGLVEYPSAVYVTSRGVWVVGSHDGSSATSRQVGERFERTVHPALSWNIDDRAFLEANDGSIWVGAWVDFDPDRGQLGGVLQFKDGAWIHHQPPSAPDFAYGIAQTSDGLLWFCGEEVKLFDGSVWLQLREPAVLARSWTDAIHTTSEGHLWVGTRTHGIFAYDGSDWTTFSRSAGLAGNRVYAISGDDGGVWVSTDRGVSVFDGSSWVTQALPEEVEARGAGNLRTDRSGGVWASVREGFRNRERPGANPDAAVTLSTIRYQPDTQSPDTEIRVATDRVSSPGNTVFAWQGFDRFKQTPDPALQYAWRLNGGDWSRFESETYNLFMNLADGDYVLEVAARDGDLNVDPTPARVSFVVGP